MLASLSDLLPEAASSSGAIACCNVFGWDEAQMIIGAAETCQRPVILSINKDMVDWAGVELCAAMMLPLAHKSTVQVVVHLDHCYHEEIVFRAIHAGFSSVMFDGSQLPLAENISRTRAVCAVAHALGVSVEGEIGSVAYHEGRDHIVDRPTEVNEAMQFASDSQVDAVAISIGNVHRKPIADVTIDFRRLADIAALVKQPLVIHGTTGIARDDIARLKTTRIAKFNLGTSLRQALGSRLRELMHQQPEQYDRSHFARLALPSLQHKAEEIISMLAPDPYQ